MNQQRLDRALTLLQEMDTDALLITSPANRRYVTGFSSAAGAAFSTDVVLLYDSGFDLIVAPIHVDWAKGEAPLSESVISHRGSMVNAVMDVVRERGWSTLAVEADALPYPEASRLKVEMTGVEVRFATNLRALLRNEKDDSELEALEQAAVATDEVFASIIPLLAPGISEAELARVISSRLQAVGDGLAFDVIVASGLNAARPHHRPGERVLEADEPVIVDMGCRIRGYCGDLTRTLFTGHPNQRYVEIYRAVLDAQVATKAAIRSGASVGDVALAADESLQRAGLGDYILHSVGHGVGLEIHETPSVRGELTDLLKENSVVTVEPGVYIPGWGGVRIEDVVVVTSDGCRTLTTAPKMHFD
jgi:Xaa-Pro aminopeptidase